MFNLILLLIIVIIIGLLLTQKVTGGRVVGGGLWSWLKSKFGYKRIDHAQKLSNKYFNQIKNSNTDIIKWLIESNKSKLLEVERSSCSGTIQSCEVYGLNNLKEIIASYEKALENKESSVDESGKMYDLYVDALWVGTEKNPAPKGDEWDVVDLYIKFLKKEVDNLEEEIKQEENKNKLEDIFKKYTNRLNDL